MKTVLLCLGFLQLKRTQALDASFSITILKRNLEDLKILPFHITGIASDLILVNLSLIQGEVAEKGEEG